MLNDIDKTSLFCEYYEQWVDVYKKCAILDAVDESLIERVYTRKAIINRKTLRTKTNFYLSLS